VPQCPSIGGVWCGRCGLGVCVDVVCSSPHTYRGTPSWLWGTHGCPHVCTCTCAGLLAYLHTLVPMLARAPIRPNLCAHPLALAPPYAPAPVRVRVRARPHIYIIPTLNITQEIFPDPGKNPKREVPP